MRVGCALVIGATWTRDCARLDASFETITHGRRFWISLPIVGSKLIHQTPPRFTAVLPGFRRRAARPNPRSFGADRDPALLADTKPPPPQRRHKAAPGDRS